MSRICLLSSLDPRRCTRAGGVRAACLCLLHTPLPLEGGAIADFSRGCPRLCRHVLVALPAGSKALSMSHSFEPNHCVDVVFSPFQPRSWCPVGMDALDGVSNGSLPLHPGTNDDNPHHHVGGTPPREPVKKGTEGNDPPPIPTRGSGPSSHPAVHHQGVGPTSGQAMNHPTLRLETKQWARPPVR